MEDGVSLLTLLMYLGCSARIWYTGIIFWMRIRAGEKKHS
jgi:hypothetical protein